MALVPGNRFLRAFSWLAAGADRRVVTCQERSESSSSSQAGQFAGISGLGPVYVLLYDNVCGLDLRGA